MKTDIATCSSTQHGGAELGSLTSAEAAFLKLSCLPSTIPQMESVEPDFLRAELKYN